jgi:His-Xaa-Ser system radical SAM maturase HxsC
MLPLNGIITGIRGFDPAEPRQLFRVRSPTSCPEQSADAALVRGPDDFDAAVASGFFQALVISDANNALLQGNGLSRVVLLPTKFDYLADGDILGFHPATKRFRTLYRRSSAHNSFLVTERCNHYCLMCSQPPREVADFWILREIRDALPLVDEHTQSLGFTGGEPLLDWRDFIAVLTDCRDLLPKTAIHVLSNGRAFASTEVVAAWANIQHPNLTVGIPIYSAVDTVHDYVVQAKGAFDQTVLGILKLKDKSQRVEIRVVLHAITAPRIVATCRWLARNLPFIDHVALMGLENTGFAIANDELLWIDPIDYQDQLAEAVYILAASGVPVSVYNLPRCVLARSVWPYAAQSISDWKNTYLVQCNGCDEKLRCSGFFSTGRPRYSRGIQPIVNAAYAQSVDVAR